MTVPGKLENLIQAIERDVRALVRQKHTSFDVFSLGTTDNDQRHPPGVTC